MISLKIEVVLQQEHHKGYAFYVRNQIVTQADRESFSGRRGNSIFRKAVPEKSQQVTQLKEEQNDVKIALLLLELLLIDVVSNQTSFFFPHHDEERNIGQGHQEKHNQITVAPEFIR